MLEVESEDNIDYRGSPRLHEVLSPEDIEQLNKVFHQTKTAQKFSQHGLRNILNKFKIVFTEEQYKRLFLRVGSLNLIGKILLKYFEIAILNFLIKMIGSRLIQIEIISVIGKNLFLIC